LECQETKYISSSTGISIPNKSNSENLNHILSLYPTHANELLTVELSNCTINEKFQIYNVLGELVKEVDSNGLKTQIGIEDIRSGFYIVKLKQHDSSMKFLKQ